MFEKAPIHGAFSFICEQVPKTGLGRVLAAFDVLVVLVAVVLVVLWFLGHVNDKTAVFFGTIAALIQWILTSKLSIDSDRRKHTMDILIGTLFSDVYKKHVDNIEEKFPFPKKVTDADIENTGNKDAIESIRVMANYYEFLAVAIQNESVDETILRNCLKDMAINFYERIGVYITFARKKYGSRDGGAGIYNYFEGLCQKWGATKKPKTKGSTHGKLGHA